VANIVGTSNADTLLGTLGTDNITAGAGNDTVNPGLGLDDSADGEDGDDLLILDFSVTDTGRGVSGYGSSNNTNFQRLDSNNNLVDRLTANNFERFEITATGYEDTLFGGDGNDTLLAGDGNDSLVGGEGDDTLLAGDGNDILNGDGGQRQPRRRRGELIRFSEDFSNQTTALVFDSTKPVATQTLADGSIIANFEVFENIQTGSGSDRLVQLGQIKNDFRAGAGNDTVNPGLGLDDYADGGDGDDLLILDFSVTDTGQGVSGYGSSNTANFQRPRQQQQFGRSSECQ
jgi:Ca2+-binding RTX toxin-like protein